MASVMAFRSGARWAIDLDELMVPWSEISTGCCSDTCLGCWLAALTGDVKGYRLDEHLETWLATLMESEMGWQSARYLDAVWDFLSGRLRAPWSVVRWASRSGWPMAVRLGNDWVKYWDCAMGWRWVSCLAALSTVSGRWSGGP